MREGRGAELPVDFWDVWVGGLRLGVLVRTSWDELVAGCLGRVPAALEVTGGARLPCEEPWVALREAPFCEWLVRRCCTRTLAVEIPAPKEDPRRLGGQESVGVWTFLDGGIDKHRGTPASILLLGGPSP